MEQLRPFVDSKKSGGQLLTKSASEIDIFTPFRALCKDVLETKVAYLIALGPLAPLAGSPLTYPENRSLSLPLPNQIADLCHQSPRAVYLQIEPADYNGAMWAVPLWRSEQGLIGLLLLGEKQGGRLYNQEEIEIARATSERLIDTQASAEFTRRLIELQRQRLTESQIIDRQSRRVLHDEVLPILHAAMLSLNSEHVSSDALSQLADVHRQISDLLRDIPTSTESEIDKLGLTGMLHRVVESEFANAFDGVTWQVDQEAEQNLPNISSLTTRVIFYATREIIRNAARYGRKQNSTQPLHLRIGINWKKGLEIIIEDDGIGTNSNRLSSGGSKQGLALHSTMMVVVGGSLSVESVAGEYTRVLLLLPQTALEIKPII